MKHIHKNSFLSYLLIIMLICSCASTKVKEKEYLPYLPYQNNDKLVFIDQDNKEYWTIMRVNIPSQVHSSITKSRLMESINASYLLEASDSSRLYCSTYSINFTDEKKVINIAPHIFEKWTENFSKPIYDPIPFEKFKTLLDNSENQIITISLSDTSYLKNLTWSKKLGYIRMDYSNGNFLQLKELVRDNKSIYKYSGNSINPVSFKNTIFF